MGRIFEVRKATMFARWDKMAKGFARVAKEITIAVKAGGPDPDSNPSLRRAIQNGRALNMPKWTRSKTPSSGLSGQSETNYQMLNSRRLRPARSSRHCGETATDNPVRTVSNVRRTFKEYGGNMGATGSVSFLLSRWGSFASIRKE